MRAVLMFATFATSVLASLPAHAQTGDLWEIRMQTVMAGMPTGAPPSTSRQCTSRNREENPFRMQREDCKITDQVKTSDGFRWKMTCNDGTTGSGRLVYSGMEAWDLESKMTVQGHEMTTKMTGKRVGSCELAAKK